MSDLIRIVRLQGYSMVTVLFLVCTIVGSSCFISNAYMEGFTFPKWIVLCFGSSLIMLMFALRDFRRKVFCNDCELLLGIISLCILFLLLLKAHKFYDVAVWAVFNCFYIACRLISSQVDIIKMASISFIFSAGISSVVAIEQFIENKDLTGCYDNLVGLDITLLFGILSIFHLLKSQVFNKRNKLFLCFVILVFFTIALMTKSRLFVLALMMVGIINFPNRKKKIVISIVVSILCLISFFDSQKNESTHGRGFILKTSLTLLDSPGRILGGYGENGFKSNYMIRQSEQLEKEPEVSKQRASNIIHPLNEFVLISIKYGVILPVMILMILGFVLYSKSATTYTKIVILVITTYALFSYPLKYPISWIAMAVAIASNMETIRCKKPLKCVIYNSIPILIVGNLLLVFTFYSIQMHHDWKIAHTQAVLGQRQQSLSKYDELLKRFKNDEFIYNYSSYLYNLGMDVEANSVLSNISLIDYETKMLSGRIKVSMEKYEDALKDFSLAYDMCPNRFSPLFEIYKIYEKTNNRKGQIEFTELIRNKPIKVPSSQIDYIIDYVTQK